MTATAAGAGRFVKVSAAMILSEEISGCRAPISHTAVSAGLPELEPGSKPSVPTSDETPSSASEYGLSLETMAPNGYANL